MIYLDKKYSYKARAKDLLKRMNIDEKISEMNHLLDIVGEVRKIEKGEHVISVEDLTATVSLK